MFKSSLIFLTEAPLPTPTSPHDETGKLLQAVTTGHQEMPEKVSTALPWCLQEFRQHMIAFLRNMQVHDIICYLKYTYKIQLPVRSLWILKLLSNDHSHTINNHTLIITIEIVIFLVYVLYWNSVEENMYNSIMKFSNVFFVTF